VACDAFGYCAELLPELITLDEWGYPIIDPGPVPGDLIAGSRAAVKACPRRALQLAPTPAPGGPTPRSGADRTIGISVRPKRAGRRQLVGRADEPSRPRQPGLGAQPSATPG
jgi:ferredoxin